MNNIHILSTITTAIGPAVSLCAAVMKRPTQEEDAIRRWVRDYTDAWNRHDAKALALLFAEDANLVGGSGGVISGRHHIEEVMAEEHATSLKGRNLAVTIEEIRFLKPDLAVVNGTYEATGTGSSTQADTLKGLYTLIAGKERRKWIGLGIRSIVR
jgi:uncharacterized protein (TIGR02246 family)